MSTLDIVLIVIVVVCLAINLKGKVKTDFKYKPFKCRGKMKVYPVDGELFVLRGNLEPIVKRFIRINNVHVTLEEYNLIVRTYVEYCNETYGVLATRHVKTLDGTDKVLENASVDIKAIISTVKGR